jgi:L-histidine N-alpha-methyltransferase
MERIAAPAAQGRARITVLADGEEWMRERRADAVRRLLRSPKELTPDWLYDARGSELFERITRLPEYYPTRRELEILAASAHEIARASGAETLVELGSGSARKTRLLIDALRDRGTLRTYVPFDVSEPALAASAVGIARDYPGLEVHGIVGDFGRHLGGIPEGGRRLLAFLGGTIGNFKPEERARFLGAIAEIAGPEDVFLLGTDLIKDRTRLVAAYDDAAGVTAAFNRNALRALNRELGARFIASRFEHVARFDEANAWIEMCLRSPEAQSVWVDAARANVEFAAGEELRTEVSTKFRAEGVEGELAAAGFRLLGWWTDSRGDYALSLSTRA